MNEKEINITQGCSFYSGNVTLSLIQDGKVTDKFKVHNEGTIHFFKYMFRSLLGSNVLSLRPGKVCIFSDAKYTTKTIPQILPYTGETPIITAVAAETGGEYATLTYNFLIPSTLIQKKTIGSLQLLSMTQDPTLGDYVEYARLSLEGREVEVPMNTNVAIQWVLTLSNRVTNKEQEI